MTDPKPDLLDTLEALLAKATDLPWNTSTWKKRGGRPLRCIGNNGGSGQVLISGGLSEEDAEYLVAAANAVPTLVAVIRKLREAACWDTPQREVVATLAEVDRMLSREAP